MNNLLAPAKSTSPVSANELPSTWIDKLFNKFEDFYGAKWANQYGGFPVARVKKTWAEELAGFADKGDAISQALQAQKGNPFPPTLPEFLMLCREAAKRIGDSGAPKLTVILSPDELERNRQRAANLINQFAHSKRMV